MYELLFFQYKSVGWSGCGGVWAAGVVSERCAFFTKVF
ncbi:hypothetical protein C4K03_2061 [Pseudomonas synxantha]|uniref:Uncharacterized protein n=1 Tax=Pseudomonas synxantha TaxID=47883 RepID=A0A3G7U4M6_9PSED|nr:hypothetical protein C4K03_2061 [Pseudomonas synxantha]